VRISVVNMPWLNHVDVSWLASVIAERGPIYVVEDHAPIGALGQTLKGAVDALRALGSPPAPTVETLGVVGLPAWGTAAEVLAAHGLDAASLVRRIGVDLDRRTRRSHVTGHARVDEDAERGLMERFERMK
jgi:transketolase C-terminal domain/subunit